MFVPTPVLKYPPSLPRIPMSQSQQQPVKDSLVFVAKPSDEDLDYEERALWAADTAPLPTLCGIPLKYIS